jgi:hypothetical protein
MSIALAVDSEIPVIFHSSGKVKPEVTLRVLSSCARTRCSGEVCCSCEVIRADNLPQTVQQSLQMVGSQTLVGVSCTYYTEKGIPHIILHLAGIERIFPELDHITAM